jgi:hypothetical protein
MLVLDRLIAYCHASFTLMCDVKQQRSIISRALLAISVEIAAHVSQHPQPHLSTLECLHVLRISKEQLLLLLQQAAARMM